MKDLVFHPDAKAEFEEAAVFYEQRQTGLGDDFTDEVEEYLEKIQKMAKRFASFAEDYRKCVLQRFPYVIFFREMKREIRIHAVAHAKRKPGYWKDRTFDE